ncbi:MAG: aldo/keto reductase [Chloroflexi bacterium]|nr:aldo/keto reductase [Chloroflexota bacterium]MBL07423.1 aldo/keto reductase [Chloroflexota bacterium]|tara:strand:- start:17051 stop:17986 length:936 start_codon:yes stop_codon:yes gene_type:complete
MEHSIFGKTEVNVSKLGLGLAQVGFQLGSAEYKIADKILNTALDNGINFLDTAAMYLDSESIVGKSVGHRRDEFFLATKAGTGRTTSPDSEWTYKKIKDSVENSLIDLKTDVIDLVQLHSCETHLLEQGDVIRALQDCKLEGKIKYVGYSGDNEAAMWAVKSNLFDTLQTSYSIADQRARTKNILTEAKSRNLGIIAKRPIGNAALLGVKNHNNGQTHEHFGSAYDEYFSRIMQMTKKIEIDLNEVDPIELSMAFTLSRKEINVIIIGSKNNNHVEQNLDYMGKNLEIYQNLIKQYENIYEKLDENWRQLT